MSGDIIETGITWEHDTGQIVISTRSRSIASKLRALGLEVATDGDGDEGDYTTFRCTEEDLRISFFRRKPATEAQRRAMARARASQNAVAIEEIAGSAAPEGRLVSEALGGGVEAVEAEVELADS